MSRTIIEVLALACGLLFNIPACTCAEDKSAPVQRPTQPVIREDGPAEPFDPPSAAPGKTVEQPPVPAQKPQRKSLKHPKQDSPTSVPDIRSPAEKESPVSPPAETARSEQAPPTVPQDGQMAPTDTPPETSPAETEPPADIPPAATGPIAHQVYETSSIDERLAQLEKQNKELLERLKNLDAKIDDLKDRTDHETLGFGLGLASGLKEAKGRYFLVVDANLRYLFGCIYAQNRFGAGLTAQMRLWNVQLRWLGVGVMYYDDVPALSVPEFGRSLDLMVTSGLDWRVWEGLEIRAQVAWFIPPPGPIYDKAWKRIEQAADEFDIKDPNKRKVDKKAPEEAWDIVTDAYKRAIGSPYLIIGLRWEF